MRYRQITPEQRYTLGLLRRQGFSNAEIARIMGRHRSTIGRELARNSAAHDGAYRPSKAQERTNGRRSRSRRNSRISAEGWKLVERLLGEKLSPEQISGRLAREGRLTISHEAIYLRVWRDKHDGGDLYRHLRQPFKRRKRYASKERRGRVAGKRHISERAVSIEQRRKAGHWEMDTVVCAASRDCMLTLVERATGATLIAKLADRTARSVNRRLLVFIRRHPEYFRTFTADNGTEFHGFASVERATGVKFYFSTPYHSWERGTNENTNGLIRQYVPKRQSMRWLTQRECSAIARQLNNRPRKRYGYLTPLERLRQLTGKCPPPATPALRQTR